jgi:protein-disulfide isomerase/uncharacterized membrane protein
MAASPTRHRLALAIALAGVVVSAVTLYVDQRLASDAGYTSFCNVNEGVNCDVVLGSRYGRFLDVPVPVWSLGAFLAGVALALPGALGMASRVADLLLVTLVGSSLGFTLVMAGIAAFVVQALCILCLALYAVVAAWAIVVLPLAGRFPSAGPWLERRPTVYAGAVAGFMAAFAAGAWAAVRVPAALTTIEELRADAPKFVDYYEQLPVSAGDDVVGRGTHAKGPPDAPVTIVEFSDFQCPACAQAFLDLQDLVRRRRDVRVVFRHFPLDERCNERMTRGMHAMACLSAAAAECAGRQGKFWEYHDLLFENQATLERESLFGFARDTGLDIPSFRTCLDDPATLDAVRDDVRAAGALGVDSTPTIFVNGRRIDGALERAYYDYASIMETHRRAPPG